MFPFVYIFGLRLPMYGFFMVLGIALAATIVILRCKKQNLCWEDAVIIGVTGIGCGLTGAKLLFIFVTYNPVEIFEMIRTWNLAPMMEGGFVFYGGLIGGILGALWGQKIAGAKISIYENVLITVIPLAHAFGRIGCFCAGCCYGKPTDSVLGVVYTNPIGNTPTGIPLLPVQLFETGINLVIFGILFYVTHKHKDKPVALPLYLLMYAAARFVLEMFRYDYVRGSVFGISTSQFISIGLAILAIAIYVIRNKMNKKTV